METQKEVNSKGYETGITPLEQQRAKLPTQDQGKRNMTSYSFARNTEEPNSASSPTTPPIPKESSTQQTYSQSYLAMPQFSQGGFNQIPPQMMMNFTSPAPMYPPGMFQPGASQGPKPVLTSPSPTNPRIIFQDMQFMQDVSAGNTPCSQIDPSPTAETLIPGFLKDEIDNKTYTFPSKQVDDNPPEGKILDYIHFQS